MSVARSHDWTSSLDFTVVDLVRHFGVGPVRIRLSENPVSSEFPSRFGSDHPGIFLNATRLTLRGYRLRGDRVWPGRPDPLTFSEIRRRVAFNQDLESAELDIQDTLHAFCAELRAII